MNAYAWNPNGPNFKTRGAHIEERIAKKQAVKSSEKDEKAKVRARDKTCRWPRCKPVTRLECAHVVSKGIGGDKGTRSTADQMIQICYRHHQGKVSLHSGDLEVRPETSAGTNGPVSFWHKDELGQWFMVSREVSVGVTERQARKRTKDPDDTRMPSQWLREEKVK